MLAARHGENMYDYDGKRQEKKKKQGTGENRKGEKNRMCVCARTRACGIEKVTDRNKVIIIDND